MRRRDIITLLGGAAAGPLAARAQQRLPVIGYLHSASPDVYARYLLAFRNGLKEVGYIEGQNVAIEFRWAEDQFDRLPALAADLVRRQVNVIVTGGVPASLAAKAATTTIPIVFSTAADPVEIGLVASLSHPGANLTGATNLNVELGPKQLEVLHELVPAASVVALLVNPTSAILAERQSRDLHAAAQSLGLRLHELHASTDRDLDGAFSTLVQLGAGALVIGADIFFVARSKQLAALAAHHAASAIGLVREFPAAGGLVSYGGSISDSYRLVGVYAGRILGGENPAALPVQQTTKVELVLNLKTAKALGITVPLPLSGRADEVIE
jgi:putative tryptophan/tyrosine transport system substrate-binding protein